MNSVVKEIAGGKWWKVDFHVHTPASMDYGKGVWSQRRKSKLRLKSFVKGNREEYRLPCY